jgi:hypothetical protein
MLGIPTVAAMEEINAKADIEVGAVSGGKPEIAPLVRIFSIGNLAGIEAMYLQGSVRSRECLSVAPESTPENQNVSYCTSLLFRLGNQPKDDDS